MLETKVQLQKLLKMLDNVDEMWYSGKTLPGQLMSAVINARIYLGTNALVLNQQVADEIRAGMEKPPKVTPITRIPTE